MSEQDGKQQSSAEQVQAALADATKELGRLRVTSIRDGEYTHITLMMPLPGCNGEVEGPSCLVKPGAAQLMAPAEEQITEYFDLLRPSVLTELSRKFAEHAGRLTEHVNTHWAENQLRRDFARQVLISLNEGGIAHADFSVHENAANPNWWYCIEVGNIQNDTSATLYIGSEGSPCTCFIINSVSHDEVDGGEYVNIHDADGLNNLLGKMVKLCYMAKAHDLEGASVRSYRNGKLGEQLAAIEGVQDGPSYVEDAAGGMHVGSSAGIIASISGNNAIIHSTDPNASVLHRVSINTREGQAEALALFSLEHAAAADAQVQRRITAMGGVNGASELEDTLPQP